MNPIRQHVAILIDPQEFQRFEQKAHGDEGVSVTMGYKAEGEGVAQSVQFDASRFKPMDVAKWCTDNGYEPIRTEYAVSIPSGEEETETAPEGPPVEPVTPPTEVDETKETELEAECKPKVTAADVTAMCGLGQRRAPVTASDVTLRVIRGTQPKQRLTAAQATDIILGRAAVEHKITARQVTELAIGRRLTGERFTATDVVDLLFEPVEGFDPNQPRDEAGRFGTKSGSKTADAGANAARNAANAASEAARAGTGSHAEAAIAHRRSAEVHKEVYNRSAKEFDAALKRGDKLGASVHMAEMNSAQRNEALHHTTAMEHDKAETEFGRQAERLGYKKPSGGSRTAKVAKGIGKATWAVTKGLGKALGWTAVGAWKAGKWAAGKSSEAGKATGAAKTASASAGAKPAQPDDEDNWVRPVTPKLGYTPSSPERGFTTGPVEPVRQQRWNPSAGATVPAPPPRPVPRIGYTPPSGPSGTPQPGSPPYEPYSSGYVGPSYGGRPAWSVNPESYARQERRAASRRVSATDLIVDSILARQRDDYPDIHAAATGRLHASHSADIIAVAPVDIKAGDRVPRFNIAPAYNGGPLRVARYDLPIVVDLSGLSVNAQSVQAVLFHEETRLVGHVDTVRNTGKTLELGGACSGLDSVVAEFVNSAKRKFPWKASIEARPLERPELIPAGASVTVNGQHFKGPLYVARRAELYGVSFVPRGADDQTIVSIAASAARHSPQGEPVMASIKAQITFEEWIDAIGVTADDLAANPELEKRLRAKYEEAMKGVEKAPEAPAEGQEEDPNKPKPPAEAQDDEEEVPPPVPPEEEEKKPMAARERFDLDVIRAQFDDAVEDLGILYAKYEDDPNLDRKNLRTIQAEAKTALRTLKAKAISGRWIGSRHAAEIKAAHAATELKLVRASRPKGPVISVSRGDPEMTTDVLAAAILNQGGYSLRRLQTGADGKDVVTVIEAAENLFPDRVLQAAHTKFKGRIGLQRAIIEAAQMNGWNGRFFQDSPQECFRYAFGPPIHAEGPSTADMAGLLSNIANKFLLQGFFFVEQAWREFSAVESVNDFKTRYAYRLTGAEEFKLVPPSGELKHGTLGEESFTNKADTYGLMLNVTRTDIINDDLGAITTVPKKLGRGAGLAMNKVFWTKFLGQISTLFTGARANYQSGASTALGITGLTAAETLFMNLKDAQGEPIGHMPTILLTGTSLSATAAQLFKDTEIRQTNTGNTVYTTGNPHAGKFRPVVSRYIGNSSYSGYTTTGWGIFADPADVPVMEMVFLYGNESPTVEQADANFNTLGIQMRAFLDFGCNTQDYRGGVWSAGA